MTNDLVSDLASNMASDLAGGLGRNADSPHRQVPDHALSRLRPRARRAANTFWPPRVAMRERKPWRRLRTNLLG